MADSAAYRVPRELIAKYATPGPRYTSYPTAPIWQDGLTAAEAQAIYRANNPANSQRPLALYLHLPFCTSLCWYCGCNVKISRNKDVTQPYLEALQRELALLSPELSPQRQISQMHWGGGTPTYLSPEAIRELVAHLRQHLSFAPDAELSIEVDPRVTTFEHLAALRAAGFNRLSMGVQDFNPAVQAAVHRIQPFEITAALIAESRRLGFESINIDLMYGLPYQNEASFGDTLEQVRQLNPDRLALFHYAHVPWIKPAQKLIPLEALPDSDTKLAIFERAIAELLEQGYRYIGMDHFAKPEDALSQAQAQHTLRRNFMGYTTQAGTDLYGLGMSSISEIDGHFLQNHRDLSVYENTLAAGHLPIQRGMVLSADDHLRKAVIEQLICNGYLDFSELGQRFGIDFPTYFAQELIACQSLAEDGLLHLSTRHIDVLPRGQILIRNVCMLWDAYLSKQPAGFSKTI
ncbi:MAG: oxygen-independent coproporphyrinogen III oxidase [Candidatus Sericytochromatia bacterium]